PTNSRSAACSGTEDDIERCHPGSFPIHTGRRDPACPRPQFPKKTCLSAPSSARAREGMACAEATAHVHFAPTSVAWAEAHVAFGNTELRLAASVRVDRRVLASECRGNGRC